MIGRPITVRARLTLWFAVAIGVVLLVFTAGVFLLVKASVLAHVAERVRVDLNNAAAFVRDNPGDVAEFAEFNPDAIVLILKGTQIEHRAQAWERLGLPGPDQLRLDAEDWFWETPRDEHFRIAATSVKTGERVFTVAIAAPEDPARQSIAAVGWTMALAVPIVLLAAGVAGYWLAGRMLAPIRRMAEAAERIDDQRLSDRLPVENDQDEFGRLATLTNRSLDRLANALERQRRFTSDASHEMRTPLTAIRSAGEVALRRVQAPDQYRETIGSMLEGVARLTDLIERLLVLARADAGTQAVKFEVFDATTVVREAAELLQPVADEKQIAISVTDAPGLAVQADRLWLRQSVLNILDNAIKYTPPGGKVGIDLSARENVVNIAVRDSGPGIAPEHRERVFERFFRVDAARTRSDAGFAGGAGLGLAIAKWAIETCGGRITLDSEAGKGSTFTIVVPAHHPHARERAGVPIQ